MMHTNRHPYAVTIFLSAFLLFLVQPLIARQILPWFGGAASVWTTCLVFFQCVLLAGYAYAHAIARWLKPRQQVYVHTTLLLASLLVLPILAHVSWKPTGHEDPIPRILGLLLVTIGAPYVLLSATTPLLRCARPGVGNARTRASCTTSASVGRETGAEGRQTGGAGGAGE